MKKEEQINHLVFNELKQENNIDLIYLNSQLAAEKARSVYFCSVLDLKRNNEDLDFHSLQMRLSTGSSDDTTNPFTDLKDLLKKDVQDFSTQKALTRRFSERFSVTINNSSNDIKNKIKKYERKIEKLEDFLDEQTRSLRNEEMKNDSLKELVLALEEKTKKKDLIISGLKGELKICEIELEEAEKNRENCEKLYKQKGFEETSKLKEKLEACQAKVRDFEESKKVEVEKLSCQIRELMKVNASLQQENFQLGKRIVMISQDFEKTVKKMEKGKEELQKIFEHERKVLETEYKEKIDALKLSLKVYEDMQDAHSCSENTDNELSELDDANRRVSSDICAYTLISLEKPVSFESIKIVDSIDHINDESINSIKSYLQKINSTCQTDNDLVSFEKYDEVIVLNEQLLEKIHENEEKILDLSEKLEDLLKFSEFFVLFAGKNPIRPGWKSKDLEEVQKFFIDMKKELENCKAEVLTCLTQETFSSKCINLSLQSQEIVASICSNIAKPVPKKKHSMLFWNKSNPIVSQLFG